MTNTTNSQNPPFGTPEYNQCPYDFYKAARESGGAYPIPQAGLSMISRHEDVKVAAKDAGTFSSHRGTFGVGDPELEAIMKTGWPAVGALVTADPPEHLRYRKLVARGFSARSVAIYEPLVEEVVAELLDSFPASGEIEFMADFAIPMSTRIISRIMGVPASDEARFTTWADMIAESVSGYLPRERALECASGLVEMQHYFVAMVEERRANPGPDLISTIVNAEEADAAKLDLPEILEIIRIFVAGGSESTASLLGSAFYLLLTHPEQFEQVKADRGLVPGMLEEVLRLESPVQWNPRTLESGSGTVGHTEIGQGERAMLCWGSANRDPECFGDTADQFDIHRDSSAHIAFGHAYHLCVGAPLARLEAITAFNSVLDRFNDIELVPAPEDVVFVGHGVVRRIEALPLRIRRRS